MTATRGRQKVGLRVLNVGQHSRLQIISIQYNVMVTVVYLGRLKYLRFGAIGLYSPMPTPLTVAFRKFVYMYPKLHLIVDARTQKMVQNIQCTHESSEKVTIWKLNAQHPRLIFSHTKLSSRLLAAIKLQVTVVNNIFNQHIHCTVKN